MHEVVRRVSEAAGIAPDTAAKAIGIVLDLIAKEAPEPKVSALFDRVPGARDLAQQDIGGGGLFGAIGGNAMGAYARLTKAGLSTAQMKSAGEELLNYARATAGDDLVDDIVKEIPALSKFV